MYICPICGYDRLEDSPYCKQGAGSYEICPCCGYEFGYTDQYFDHDEYRKDWIHNGARWWSKSRKQPEEWSLKKQLANINVKGDASLRDG